MIVSAVGYCELEVTTNFTFLTGASHPEEYVRQAAALGYSSVAITDVDSVAGLVRAHVEARDRDVQLVCGARLGFTDAAFDVLVYPTDRNAWGGLCRVLTRGRRRADKGECHMHLDDLLEHHAGLLAVIVPSRDVADVIGTMHRLREVFDDDRLSMAVHRHLGGEDVVQCGKVFELARQIGVPLVATNAVQFHAPARRRLHDVIACVRMHCTLEEAGTRLLSNSERHLKGPEAMARLFADLPEALARSVDIAARATGGFSLEQVRYVYPRDTCPDGVDENDHLRALVEAGLGERYPDGAAPAVLDQIEHELALIADLGYASYFLTVHDIVRFARSRRILCQGRGAAANSAVCFVLGLTAVDPARGNLLFERFVSRERDEPPDIDIDFEHDRREEVIQYIYRRYGRDRAALCATVITYRWRSAIREVGKVFGLSLDVVERLAKGGGIAAERRASKVDSRLSTPRAEAGPLLSLAIETAESLTGFPRHRSQHVGGFIITRGPLEAIVPIENAAMEGRTVIEWDKDDLDAMGFLKIDVLGLGMLACIRRCLDMLPPLELATIPAEDPAVYDMCCRADTVGVFQIESRAQMAMLPRMRPRCFYDLVVEIALVRPGPIQGGMVHPYLRRREGVEPVTYPDDGVRSVLERTLGVPIFQEQAMRLAMVAGGFTAGQAEQLRRAMGAWRRRPDTMRVIGGQLVAGMRARGYDRGFIERCWKQIHGFSEYGFPESHSASFALLVYASAWIKCHHPAVFACGLLNSQPMGFYAPAQIVRDAQEHGVEVRPVDVNHSTVGCTLEPGEDGMSALRLGLCMVRGLARTDAEAIALAAVRLGRVESVYMLHRAGDGTIGPGALRRLASADAFTSAGIDRQAALWEIRLIDRGETPLFVDVDEARREEAAVPGEGEIPSTGLPRVPLHRQVVADYQSVGLSLKAHPMAFLRTWLDVRGARSSEGMRVLAQHSEGRGERVAVGGLVLVRQRPHTAKGMVFLTIEDETGPTNVVMGPDVYRRCRAAVRMSPAVLVHGVVQRHGDVVHLRACFVEAMPTAPDAHDALADMSRAFC